MSKKDAPIAPVEPVAPTVEPKKPEGPDIDAMIGNALEKLAPLIDKIIGDFKTMDEHILAVYAKVEELNAKIDAFIDALTK